MRIKTKVALGVASLFVLMLALCGLGIFYINVLSNDAQNILKDNYETLHYTRRIIESADSLTIDSARAWNTMATNLALQENNLTEEGERELTAQLRQAFEELKQSRNGEIAHRKLRAVAIAIQDMNMKAIVAKNELAQARADDASTYMIIIGTLCAIAAFVFIVNFPGYVADPIAQLTGSIQSIAKKDYEERLHFNRKDEFEELAQAFNLMAEKLDEYEHSNLAKILFEKKRIETLINRMTDPVIGLDENARIIFVNEQAIRLLNLTQKDLIGLYAPDVAVNNDLFRSLIRKPSDHDEGAMIKVVVEGRENYFSKENIQVMYRPTGEKDDVSVGNLILLRNITPYKELDLAKTHFMATISHELKTPIASLQMCVKLMQDQRIGSLNAEQGQLLRTLETETSRLAKLTHELLDLSQLETGNIKLNIRETDARMIIEQAIEATRFQAERKQINVIVNGPAAKATVQSDADKTTWVLVNFLSNAIRFSPEGDTVVVVCEQIGNAIFFKVVDHGPGIEERYLGRIFEKFFQVPGTASGTGLGLAISKEFIEAQGGSVSVTSSPGKGSEFQFQLPAASVVATR